METAEQREQRIARLEAGRAARKADVTWPTPDDAGFPITPLQVAPGRGNLEFTSGFMPTFPTALRMLGNRTVSFSRIFMSQPWVAAAVMRMLTWGVRVPLRVYRRTGLDPADKIQLHPGDHPFADAIYKPHGRGGQIQLTMSMLGPLLVHGNAVNRVAIGRSGEITINPKDWRFCRPIMPFRDTIDGFTFDYDSPMYREDVSIDEVLHVAWWSPIGPVGTSPLQQLGVTLQIEDSAQRWQRSLLANGARPPSALTVAPEFLGLEAAERKQILKQLREDIINIYSGPEAAGTPALLPPGLEWKGVGHTAVEAELIDQRKINREEVAAVYLIPPPLMGILDRATYSNIETQRDMTYTDCLGPPLVLCEQAINAQIARDLLQEPDVFVEYDFGAVLRGDRLKEIDAIRDGIATALFSPNEGRGILNLKKSEDQAMDQFYLPFNNLQPVGQGPVPNVNSPSQTPDPQWSPNQPPDNQRGRAQDNQQYRAREQKDGSPPVFVPSSARDLQEA
jgi:HK97 family phage portal protein